VLPLEVQLMDNHTVTEQDWQGYWGRKQKSSNKVTTFLQTSTERWSLKGS
jgi:hypothetical protein